MKDTDKRIVDLISSAKNELETYDEGNVKYKIILNCIESLESLQDELSNDQPNEKMISSLRYGLTRALSAFDHFGKTSFGSELGNFFRDDYYSRKKNE